MSPSESEITAGSVRSDRYMPDQWTLPEVSRENTQFFTTGEIRLQYCAACGQVQHPPVPICGSCQSSDFEYRPGSRTGIIESFTIVHHPVHPMLADRVPYNVIVVALDEPAGVRIVGNLLAPEDQPIGIGLRVSATWAESRQNEPDRDGSGRLILLPQWEVLV